MKNNFIRKYLPNESLDKIAKVIGNIEKKTSGEMRICIKKKRTYFEKNLTPREIAIKKFFKLKMDRTIDKTGVLFLILFDEHKFEIIADKGINSKIDKEQWDEISNDIKNYFKKENFFEGISYALNKIGEVLIKEFPIKDDDKDELSDEVVIKP